MNVRLADEEPTKTRFVLLLLILSIVIFPVIVIELVVDVAALANISNLPKEVVPEMVNAAPEAAMAAGWHVECQAQHDVNAAVAGRRRDVR